jgi:NADH-quinone oxidoreductase subunit L
MLLAIPSVLIGYYTIEPMLFGDFFKGAITVNAQAHPAMTEFAKIFHGPMAMASHALSTPPFWLALAGVVTAWYFYLINPAVPAAIGRTLRPLVVLLENKYYMDWFNEHVLARAARGLGMGLWKGGDQAVIDGAVVNGSWRLVAWVSAAVRQLQSGFIYHYALAMIIGIFLLMTWFVWLNR